MAVTGLDHDADQQNIKEKEMTKETKKKEEHKIKETQKMKHPRKEEEKRKMAWRIFLSMILLRTGASEKVHTC
jgi:hypothetical protein